MPSALSRFDLSGRTALVTGGSRGLGRAIAQGFAEAGAHTLLTARDEHALSVAAGEIREFGHSVAYRCADMSRRTDVDTLGQWAFDLGGQVDIAVLNAGRLTPGPVERINDSAWDEMIELNLASPMRLARFLSKKMQCNGWGRIIFVSSILALRSHLNCGAYSAAKAGLIGLTQSTSVELGAHGVTVNCLAPGPFLTDSGGKSVALPLRNLIAQSFPLGRWGNPDEIVGPALLLASDAGAFITGTVLVVDGGVSARASCTS